jgi:hypothetical protein
MPNGSLTPLGRQLRSVLGSFAYATKSRSVQVTPFRHVLYRPCDSAQDQKRPASVAAAAVPSTQVEEEQKNADEQTSTSYGNFGDPTHRKGSYSSGRSAAQEQGPTRNGPSQLQLRRRTRVDRLSEALRDAGQHDVAATRRWKPGLSHMNVKSPTGWKAARINAERHRDDDVPKLAHAMESKVSRVLASYIRLKHEGQNTGEAEWMAPSLIDPRDEALLRAQGYDLEDLEAWANIVTLPDSLEAVMALDRRISEKGVAAVPFFLLSYILRRPSIRPQALRMLVRISWDMLEYRSTEVTTPISADGVFLVFVRLVRHARQVWPAALESLTAMLLRFLPRPATEKRHRYPTQINPLTYQLNKAMNLLALPTSVEPYKSSAVQLASVIRILRFMTEHDPPLEINREGYRAVVLVQLAQPKSAHDQLWAQLKALSWPPWKEDRTAMDAEITRHTHGTSKAAEALQRMREAGFAPLAFEQIAGIYAGWDGDGTPTIQTRIPAVKTSLPVEIEGGKGEVSAAMWAARIDTTRTVQEAWACYEVYEKQTSSPNQAVCLAIFKKLYQEEQRKIGKDSRARTSHLTHLTKLLPGDTEEISPLPPSTHLHTYTTRPPPTVHGYYRELRRQGIVLEVDCLAFIVENATTTRNGMQYLDDSQSRYKNIQNLLLLEDDADLTGLPDRLIAAFIALLSRFSRGSLRSSFPERLKFTLRPDVNSEILDGQRVNSDHPLVHSVELLRQHRPRYRPIWCSVLRALGHESSLDSLWGRFQMRRSEYDNYVNLVSMTKTAEQDLSRSAIMAFRVFRRVMSMMKEVHLDLDADGFMSLCNATENMTMGCWMIMRYEEQSVDSPHPTKPKPHLKDAVQLMRTVRGHMVRLRGEFANLVGSNEVGVSITERGLELPRLLETPSPAVLHAYIRALGWLGDYDGLLETVRWMAEHRPELASKRERDRNGEAMMRRALTALRVFLERSWLPEDERPKQRELDSGDLEDSTVRLVLPRNLARLESPAEAHVIEEAKELVGGVEEWGGWATDEEVETYCQNERFVRFQSKPFKRLSSWD